MRRGGAGSRRFRELDQRRDRRKLPRAACLGHRTLGGDMAGRQPGGRFVRRCHRRGIFWRVDVPPDVGCVQGRARGARRSASPARLPALGYAMGDRPPGAVRGGGDTSSGVSETARRESSGVVPLRVKGDSPLSVDRIRFREGEGGDPDVEALPGLGHHLIRALHDAEWRGQGAPRGVLERLARAQRGLLSHDPGAADLFDVPGAIGDDPVTRDELQGFEPFIQDRHRIEKEPLILAGLRPVWGVFGFNSDAALDERGDQIDDLDARSRRSRSSAPDR